jgi:RNA polymerase II subunit A-like phosphatase
VPSAVRISPCTSPLHHPSQALALTLPSFALLGIACSYTDFNSEGLSAINRPTSLSISHSTPNLKVTHSEATRLHSTHTSLLHSTKRLTLIVDLDQTVVHATVDPTVGDWMEDLSRPETERRLKGEEGRRNMKEVGRFTLDERGGNGCWYYLKPRSVFFSSSPSNQVRTASAGADNVASIPSQSNPPCRPGLARFLELMHAKYEMHVYTMGTRLYANEVCKLIDPLGRYFGDRILSRDESGSMFSLSFLSSKTARDERNRLELTNGIALVG